MPSDCPDCARLWNDYLASRREYASLRRGFEAANAAGDTSQVQSIAQQAQAAAGKNEQSRERLAAHQRKTHGQG
jgi:hypothetical protein